MIYSPRIVIRCLQLTALGLILLLLAVSGVRAQTPVSIPNLYAWWDATTPAGVADVNGNPLTAYAAGVDHAIDLTGNGHSLNCREYSGSFQATRSEVPRVDQTFGALSEVVPWSADWRGEPGSQLNGPTVNFGSGQAWTIWMTWTRPRWKFHDTGDGAGTIERPALSTSLIQVGTTTVLNLPGGDPAQMNIGTTTIPVNITQRHTHSIVIRNIPGSGLDVWLDGTQVVSGGPNSLGSSLSGTLALLADGGLYLHDAGVWQSAITNAQAVTLNRYLTRYYLGQRYPLGEMAMGQSNQGMIVGVYYEQSNRFNIPQYLNGYVTTRGLGTVGSGTIGTIWGGNSLYSTGTQASFLRDPGDGSDPSTWALAGAGTGCMNYFASLSATDKEYITYVHWLQGESDEYRPISQLLTYESVCKEWMSRVRTALGRTAANLPWVVPAIQPYGYGAGPGADLVRRAWYDIANLPGNPYDVYILSRNNDDTDINYGVANFGDAHMNKSDCLQMTTRDGLVLAKIFQQRGYTDGLSISAPTTGPSIISAQKISPTILQITVQQDPLAGDLTVPASAAAGLGWAVQDGATTIAATSCTRISPTTLQITLASPIATNTPTVTYCDGDLRLANGNVSGHGNAIYDNSVFPNNQWSPVLPLPLGLSFYPTPITAGTSAPSAATGFTATAGNTQVALNWNASGGALSYTVLRGSKSGGSYATIATGITETFFTDTAVANGATYYYVVIAVNGNGSSANSSEVSATPLPVTPAPPFGLSATGNNAQILLGWLTSVGATSYNVKRSITSGGPYTTVATNVTTSYYKDTSVVNNTIYYYVISSVSGPSESGNSVQVVATPVLLAPAVPTNVTAASGNAQIALSWTASANATSYNIKRSTSSGGPYTVIGTPVAPNYVDSTAVNGTVYYYVVSALTATAESANSSQVTGTPTAVTPVTPTTLKATAGNTLVVLAWAAGAGDNSYNVYRATVTGGPYVLIASGGTTPAYTDAGLTNGTTYYYVVAGVNGGAVSANSGQVAATPVLLGSTAPQVPTGVTATAGIAQVALGWSASSGALSYNIYRSTTNGGPYASLASSSKTSYSDATATNGTAYYYVVTAVNSGGESSYSSQVNATPEPALPVSPAGLIATAGNAQIGLSWTASSGASSYNVKRSASTGGPYITVGSATTVTYLDLGLANDTTYYYVVTAVNGVGESSNSPQVSATPTGGGLPVPWVDAVVGAPTPTGSAAYSPATGVFSVNAGGDNITGGSDALNYVYQPISGNGTIVARVTGVQNTNAAADAGVMIRETTAATSSESSVFVTPGNGIAFISRPSDGGTGVSTTALAGVTAPYWLKAVRNGTIFTVYAAPDIGGAPGSWTGQGTVTIAMTANVLVGLGVCSFAQGTACAATFDNVSVTAGTSPSVPTGLVATAGNASVALTWNASAGATAYNVYRATSSNGPFTTALASSTTTGYVDTLVTNGLTYYYEIAASGAGITSANSSPAVSATPVAPPSAPEGLAAGPTNASTSLTWTASARATSYNVKRSTSNGSGYATIASPTGTSYVDSTVAGGGTYYYVVSAVNAGGESANSAQVVTTTPLSFTQWIARYNQAGGQNAMPQNDGLSNLFKFVFDIDPTQTMSPADLAALPAVALTTTGGQKYLTLTYRQNALLSGVTVNLQSCNDLTSWQTVQPALSQQVGVDPVTGDPLIQLGVNVTGLNRMFLRLNATSP